MMTAEELKRLTTQELLGELARQVAIAYSISIIPGAMREDLGLHLRDDLDNGTLCEIGDFRISARHYD